MTHQGDYANARAEFLAVLELQRELGDRHGEAATLDALARIPEGGIGRTTIGPSTPPTLSASGEAAQSNVIHECLRIDTSQNAVSRTCAARGSLWRGVLALRLAGFSGRLLGSKACHCTARLCKR